MKVQKHDSYPPDFELRFIDDNEAIELIKRLCSNKEKRDTEDKILALLEHNYHNIRKLLFFTNKNMTPEEILAEAKEKSKPICL